MIFKRPKQEQLIQGSFHWDGRYCFYGWLGHCAGFDDIDLTNAVGMSKFLTENLGHNHATWVHNADTFNADPTLATFERLCAENNIELEPASAEEITAI